MIAPEPLRDSGFYKVECLRNEVLGGEFSEKMGKSGEDLTTVAKVSKETGISAGMIRKALKDASVKPDLVKAGCSYYSRGRVDSIVRKLKKA